MKLIKQFLKKIYSVPILYNLVNKLLTFVIPAPYLTDTMELKYGLWEGISSAHVQDGRQLGENNVKPLYRRDTRIITNLHTSKLEGTRAGLVMNMSALQILMKQWEPSLKVIGAIRNLYLERLNKKNTSLSVFDCYMVAKICVALPVYLIRKSKPIIQDGELPPNISAQFQLISGVFMIVRKMIENGEGFLSEKSHLTAEELFEYADKNNIFISEHNGQVCGGSKKKIVELLDFVLSGNDAVDSLEFITDIVQDVDSFFEYALAAIELELVVAQSKSMSRSIFLSLAANIENDSGGDSYDDKLQVSDIDVFCLQDSHRQKKLLQEIKLYSLLLNDFGSNKFSASIDFNKDISPQTKLCLDNSLGDTKSKLQCILDMHQAMFDKTTAFLNKQQSYVNKPLGRRVDVNVSVNEMIGIIGVLSDSDYIQLKAKIQ